MDKEKVRIRQTRSLIGRPKGQKRTIKALGLGRIGQYVDHKLTPPVRGMIAKIAHLVDVKEE